MSADDRRIRTVAVVGDGIAGWSAAAAVARRVPGVSVALVPAANSARSMADLIGGTVPSVLDFHRDIGIYDPLLPATIRLGTEFVGWTGSGSAYVHAFGQHGGEVGSSGFHHHWVRGRVRPGALPFDSYSTAAALARHGSFLPAEAIGDARLATYSHTLQLDPARYRAYLRGYAVHLGVAVSVEPLATVEASAGRITGLRLADGERLTADLYIDATGADRRLLGALGEAGWESWRAWLPCDGLTLSERPFTDEPPLLDRIEATDNGWRLDSAMPGKAITAFITADDAAAHKFAAGRVARAWIGNVVGIGETAVVVEPLEATALHLVHAHIDRLIASLPDRDYAAIELDAYNCETAEEADRLRDFLILHYVTATRSGSFWDAVRAVAPPPALAETLALFRERGRLPIRDGESFSRDSWLAVLIGQEVIPRRVDILAEADDADAVARRMATFERLIAHAVARAPSHTAYLRRYLDGGGR